MPTESANVRSGLAELIRHRQWPLVRSESCCGRKLCASMTGLSFDLAPKFGASRNSKSEEIN